MKALYSDDLAAAKEGSYYTILGTGGPRDEWVANYEKLLEKAEIGKPVEWFTTTGESVNAFAAEARGGRIDPSDKFQPGLAVMLFPLTGLHIGRLAMFRIQWQDRWFDDIIQNMKVVHG